MNNLAFKALNPIKYAWNTMILRWKDFIVPTILIGILPVIFMATLIFLAFIFTNENITFVSFIKSINPWWHIIILFAWFHVWLDALYTKISLDCYENKPISIKKNILFILPLTVKIVLIKLLFDFFYIIHNSIHSIELTFSSPSNIIIWTLKTIFIMVSFYFTVKLSWALSFIIDKNYNIKESLIASFRLTDNHFLTIISTAIIISFYYLLFLTIFALYVWFWIYVISLIFISLPFPLYELLIIFLSLLFLIATLKVVLFIIYLPWLAQIFIYKKLNEYQANKQLIKNYE